ncbi:MAG TPA: tryptophan synthase subunit alpha [Rhodospirillaceae bacterium]|jgi:tryptophan synthase alpha chain|nr:tryptophan synthase subunit alpha [Alphaproteobacteria bacterium]HBH26805.1 tryptophan synthase subunit alpha [Rhodospirillaceae bacterium]
MSRIGTVFAKLKGQRPALVTFTMAGDPDGPAALDLLTRLPGAGADILEVGMPFSDPMADGPAIAAAGRRALDAGATMAGTLGMIRDFRAQDAKTPVVLMGYVNPVLAYGVQAFCRDAVRAGADGLLLVDLPPEEGGEVAPAARAAGLDLIRLVAPTTPEARVPTILAGAGGFVYYVSITGITGAAAADPDVVRTNIAALKRRTALPVAAGFGIKTPADVRALAGAADAVVVGSALVTLFHEEGPKAALDFVWTLADSLRPARSKEVR